MTEVAAAVIGVARGAVAAAATAVSVVAAVAAAAVSVAAAAATADFRQIQPFAAKLNISC